MKLLFLGEIVGRAGVFAVKKKLDQIKKDFQPDFVLANGNGVTGGFGMGKNHAVYLKKLGVDVLTGGECIFYKRDMVSFIGRNSFILRPANFPAGVPGRGWGIFEAGETKIGVINMMGLSGYDRTHLNNPFSYTRDLVRKIKETTPHIILNFHARTTAEKRSMFFLLDGTVSAVLGTGTRVVTSDGRISGKGTAAVTDAGRTGSALSVGGLDPAIEIEKELNLVPLRSRDGILDVKIRGFFLETDEDGKAVSFRPFTEQCEDMENDSDSKSN